MKYRKLGRTGLDVSIIGMGTEYLNRKPKKTVVSVVHKAIEKGVNYFDIVFAFPEYRDNFGAALKGYRDKIVIAGHIGCAETGGHYRLTRDVKENEVLFHDLLSRLHTDYVDILMIQMVNAVKSYDQVMKPLGVMELAHRFRKEGKARFIGISGHKAPGIMRFINDDSIDTLMFPINLSWDFMPGRKEVFHNCTTQRIGLVAMKIYAGGRIFQKKGTSFITPVQCINYALSQPGVSTVVPGVKNSEQLEAALHFLEATDEEKDFGSIIAEFQENLKGNCVYCSHCLPCPVGIDIGRTIQKIDRTLSTISDAPKNDYKAIRNNINFYYPGRIRTSRSQYKELSTKASDCTECGVCMERCPFGVDIIAKMKQAVQILESQS
ncbi:MAG: hypothetical protein E3J87_04170 [Candidatus Cloacimonadota bacterium]|nr:MAG: hypothetical protein E3J87_04170 [Candidatus Cloacimonadota bacterium]